jgi:hypothetical protein
MSLDDIKKTLYKKDTDFNLAQHSQSQYNPENAPLILNNQPSEADIWEEKKAKLDEKGRKAIKIGAISFGIIIFVALTLVGIYWYRASSFSQERAVVAVTGPKEVRSGQFLTYEISYKNDNRADLKNAKLKISFPDTFKPEENPNFKLESPSSGFFDLGEVKGHAQGKVMLSGRVYTPKGAFIYIKSDLSYSPSGFSIQFTSKNELGIKVVSSPLELEITAPQNVSAGDEVNYLITYKNSGDESFDSVKVKADYPDGFQYSNSDPKPFEGNNIWYIGPVSAGQSGKIVISGKLDGDRDQEKPIKIYIGSTEEGTFVSYNEEDASSKIVTSPLVVSQIVNGQTSLNANAGDSLSFEINYKNAGDVGMRDVIVTENIDSPVLDYASLKMDGGAFDESTKTITWKSVDYKNLANLEPGQGGRIKFSIKVKGVIPVSGSNDKNYVISSVSKIDSPDVPTPIHMNKIIAGNKMDIKLNSKLVLDTLGYYNDSGIPNSGPIPPKVNQETTYTVHWKITNISNDISQAKVESVLPTNAVFTGKTSPEDAKIEYNERANAISWNIGNISSGVGVISPVKEISFQVKIKPSTDQAGQEVDILKESKITAKDNFTGSDLSATTKEKTTNLPEDSVLGGQYRVVN